MPDVDLMRFKRPRDLLPKEWTPNSARFSGLDMRNVEVTVLRMTAAILKYVSTSWSAILFRCHQIEC